jgi:hypothetical protein
MPRELAVPVGAARWVRWAASRTLASSSSSGSWSSSVFPDRPQGSHAAGEPLGEPPAGPRDARAARIRTLIDPNRVVLKGYQTLVDTATELLDEVWTRKDSS